MTESKNSGMSYRGQTLAKPLKMQRLEASLNIDPFVAFAQEIMSNPITSGEDSDSETNADFLAPGEKVVNGVVSSALGMLPENWSIKFSKIEKTYVHIDSLDRQNDKLQIYNLSQIGSDRKWVQDTLLSDTESDHEHSDEDEYIQEMLKEHIREKKIRAKYYQNIHVSRICTR